MSLRSARFFRILIAATTLTLAACGGGGGGGGSSNGLPSGGAGGGSGGSGGAGGGGSGDSAVTHAQLGPGLGQALLGPIVDATVAVYEAENFNGVSICTVSTSPEGAPEGPGVIDLSSCPISAGSVYFLVVEGGTDIDANDDEVVDATPTAKQGALRAIISGQKILAGDFRVNIVTEIAYQSVSDALLGGAGQLEILSRLDGVARQLLSEDLNADGIVDNEDLLDFSPVDHQGLIAGEYGPLLEEILAAILSGNRNELTRLSRELLLSSLGDYYFVDLLSQSGNYRNLLIGDFLVEGDFIYAAGYEADSPENDLKVFIFDATDFSAVSLVGEYSTDGLAVNPQSAKIDMLKVGDFLYVTSQGNGLFVIDVSDPAAPAASLLLDGSYLTSMAARDGSTMYIGYDDELSASNRGVYIVDIGDPANPRIVGSVGNVTVFDLLYADGFLYVYGPGIAAYDASSPTSLSLVGTLSFPASSSNNISYKEGFIYAPIIDADAGLDGMTIVDARDPAIMTRIDDIAGIGSVTEIDVHDQTLYATASTSFGSSFTLVSFDIGSDGRLQMIDSRSTPIAYYLQYENGRVYLASAIQVAAYDANALNNKTDHLGFIATDKAANLVEVVGGVAYVANDTELLAIDVSDPAGALSVLDGVSVIDWINDMAIVGNYAYLANATEGIKVVDISDPSNLQVVGSNSELVPRYDARYDQTYYRETFAIAVQDQLAYTITGGFPDVTLGVFDIGDPAAPAVLRSADYPYPIGDIAIRNDTLYGVDTGPGSASLYTIDVADLPQHVATMDLLARAVELDGAYLYTTSSTAGLSIVNVSDERNPVLFGGTLSLGIGNALSVLGDVAYVANDFGMVEVYDIRDKTRPERVGQYPISGVVKDVFATDEYVYAVNGLGLVIEPAVHLHDALE